MAEIFKTILGDIKFNVAKIEDGSVSIIPHNELMKIATENSDRIEYTAKLLYASPPYNFAFEATATDRVSGRKVCSVIGESSPENLVGRIQKENPCNQAHIRAVDRVLIKLLGIDGKVYSNSEIAIERKTSPDSTKTAGGTIKVTEDSKDEKKEEKKTVVVDGTRDFKILFGSCKGQNYFHVKDSEAFISFLTWIKENPSLKFNDARQLQLDFFRTLKAD